MGTRFRVVAFCFLIVTPLFAGTNVLTWHNDKARTGQNLTETQLTLTNVNSTNFGKLFQINVDGKVDAQPLVVTKVSLPGKGIHNIVMIATEHDTVYCCDADDGSVLWTASLLKGGEVPSDDRGCGQVTPEIGVTATPVIDLATGPHGTIYLIAMSKSGTTYFQRIHALDLTTGAEQFSGPVDVVASYPGAGAGNNGQGMVVFDPAQYKDRAGLFLSNGIVYTAWSSHCDHDPYTGWVIGYDMNTLAGVRVLNVTPNGSEGSFWNSGAAPALDSAGNIYAQTGNGTFETSLTLNGFPSANDFGNCIVKLTDANNSLGVNDYWTMYNTISESGSDQDLGSGGALALPDLMDSNHATRHLVVGAGKDTHIYLADRDNLGKFVSGSNSTLYQDVSGALGGPVFATPAYFNGRLYYGAVGDKLKAFTFANARLGATASSQTAQTFGYPGTTPSISANGTTDAIAWAARNVNPAVLHAFNATNLSSQIYASTDAGTRDSFGVGNKFIVPTVANGKVYVGTTNSVGVFGLFNPPHLYDISSRANVGTGEDVSIGGFIINGTVSKNVIVRGMGPSTGVAGFLADPTLELRDGNGALIASNNDWQTNNPNTAQIQAANLAPGNSKESAIYATLAPGNYTAILSGVNNSTGIGLVEVYDLSTAPTSNLFNISSRANVGTGNNVLIGGIIVRGLAPETVLFRAIGPDLGAFGIAHPLSDPTLDIRDVNGVQVGANDNWKSSQQAEITATGMAPAMDADAAVLLTLPPGNYTAVVSGAGGATGIALVEAYEMK